jgi:hypothetical protein
VFGPVDLAGGKVAIESGWKRRRRKSNPLYRAAEMSETHPEFRSATKFGCVGKIFLV